MPLRRVVLYNKAYVFEIIDLGANWFESATVDTNIITYGKRKAEVQDKINSYKISLCDDIIKAKKEKLSGDEKKCFIYPKKDNSSWIILNEDEKSILDKIHKFKPLKDWDIKINSGIKTGFNEAFFIDEETKNNLIKEDAKSAKLIKPLLKGRDMRRYYCIYNNLYLINTHNGIKEKNIPPINIEDYPAIKKHLDIYYKELSKRGDKGETPYNLRNCAYLDYFDKPKIMFNKASKINAFYLDNEGKYYGDVTTYILSSNNLEYLLSILNSHMFYYAYNKYYVGGGIEGELTLFTLENFPIPEPDKDTENKLVNLVGDIIRLKKNNKDSSDIEAEVDKIVYSLYNLTDEEIRVIEGE